MYRFFVFAYETYYPVGGVGDCIMRTNDEQEAVSLACRVRDELLYGHVKVFDVTTNEYLSLPEEDNA